MGVIGRSRAAAAGLLFLVATLIGLLNAGIVLTSELAEHERVLPARPLVVELTGAYAAAVLVPAIVLLALRFPLTRETWWRRLPLHVLGSIVFGIAHTLLMWGSRTVAFELLGWGRFDYGRMTYRFLMEYQKQAVVYALVLLGVAFVGWQRSVHQRELRTVELERQLTLAKLTALRMQLDPHFLFNTLNMITSHVRESPRTAEAMLGHLADFLRLTLKGSGEPQVPLGRELELLDAYLAIMRARFEERLSVEVRIPEEAHAVLVPQLLLQPIVENAIRHGAADPGTPAVVRVLGERAEGRLRLVVEDEGPGMDASAGLGVGLSNTAERLLTLYGKEQSFALHNRTGGGLSVVIEIPWRSR